MPGHVAGVGQPEPIIQARSVEFLLSLKGLDIMLARQQRASIPTMFAFGFARETQCRLRSGLEPRRQNRLATVIADTVCAQVEIAQRMADILKRPLEHCFKGKPILLRDHSFSGFINGNCLATSLLIGELQAFSRGLAYQPAFLLPQFPANPGIAPIQARAPFAMPVSSDQSTHDLRVAASANSGLLGHRRRVMSKGSRAAARALRLYHPGAHVNPTPLAAGETTTT